MKITTWQGDENRTLAFYEPCPCGCDDRGREQKGLVGYLSGSDADGNGFTAWMTKGELARLTQQMTGAFRDPSGFGLSFPHARVSS